MERENVHGNNGCGCNALTAIGCVIIVVVVAAVLFPIFAHSTGSSPTADCQSNMKNIGNALKMYLSDWGDTYPTNRTWIGHSRKLGPIRSYVKLTTPGLTAGDGTSIRFEHGVNWVEGLYNYVEQVSKSGASMWQCPQALRNHYPPDSDTALVSYVFNRNLTEENEGIIMSGANTMLVREMDRLVNADLRPVNYSNNSSSKPPVSAFLNDRDVRFGKTHPMIHNTGSNILFADGHVEMYDKSFYPTDCAWDKDTQKWWNYAPGAKGKPGNYIRSITVTP